MTLPGFELPTSQTQSGCYNHYTSEAGGWRWMLNFDLGRVTMKVSGPGWAVADREVRGQEKQDPNRFDLKKNCNATNLNAVSKKQILRLSIFIPLLFNSALLWALLFKNLKHNSHKTYIGSVLSGWPVWYSHLSAPLTMLSLQVQISCRASIWLLSTNLVIHVKTRTALGRAHTSARL